MTRTDPETAGAGTATAAAHGTDRVVPRLAEQFASTYGGPPSGIWRAPGRVNLIGDHTDYNGGLALPFAIDQATFVAARAVPGGMVRVASLQVGSPAAALLAESASWAPSEFEHWARYPLGTVRAMQARGAHLTGLELLVTSTVPPGSGLSSSAALTVAVALAVDDLAGTGLLGTGQGRREIALAAQEAESRFAGAPCGLLDQTAVLEAGEGHGVVIDFATMATQRVPLAIGPLVVVNTRVEHSNSDGTYANRLATCQRAAQLLGVDHLAAASLDQLAGHLEGEVLKRARHVVSEDRRVAEAAQRLAHGQPIGDLMVASHASLRDDYEVSCPELDLAVETAMAHGAGGARLTGAGMGGSAICAGAPATDLAGPVREAFARAGFAEPEVYEVTPSAGAARLA